MQRLDPNSAMPRISSLMVISGHDFAFEQCSRAIGLEPTETWRKEIDLPAAPEAEWRVGFRKLRVSDLDDAMSVLLNRVWPRRSEIMRFASDNGLKVSFGCNVTIQDTPPRYRLSVETLRKIAEFQSDILLDVFDYSDRASLPDRAETAALSSPGEDRRAPWVSVGMLVKGESVDRDMLARALALEPTVLAISEAQGLSPLEDVCAFVLENLREYSTDDALRVLLGRVHPRVGETLDLGKAGGLAISFSCRVVIEVDRPIYELSPETVREIADFGAGFEMEILDFSNDPEIVLDDGTVLTRLI